jgi:hypothetical protein
MVPGEAQPFGNTRNQLFDISDMQELRAAVLQKVSAGIKATNASAKPAEPMSETEAILLGKVPQHRLRLRPLQLPLQLSQRPVRCAAVQAKALVPSDLAASADRMIASEIAQDGGDEYKDGRQIIFADLNSDGIRMLWCFTRSKAKVAVMATSNTCRVHWQFGRLGVPWESCSRQWCPGHPGG